jgi:hydroxyacylglutathione hydrolase
MVDLSADDCQHSIMDRVHAVPAFRDNYIWLLRGSAGQGSEQATAIVDPGDAAPVLQALEQLELAPVAILITHHHSDHIGGVGELCERFRIPVYGPAQESIPGITHPVREGDRVAIPGLPVFDVLDVPGHTAGHIAYAGQQSLFCGDTLFAGGCGRLFEGTAAQLYSSLQKLSQLPDEIWIYCAHEYTLSNLNFALAVEPDNPVLQNRIQQTRQLRQDHKITLPSRMGVEKLTNPFLRCQTPAIVAAAAHHAGLPLTPGVETFATLRRWKDHWQG